jgi:hypothetical protein
LHGAKVRCPSLEPDPARWATVLELELRDGAGEK